MAASAILDVRNSLSIAFLAILDQYATLFFGNFGFPKFTFDRISSHFRSIQSFYLFEFFCDKMAAVGHFGCPKFTFNHNSGHFRSIRKFNFFGNFDKMACIRPFFICPTAAIF